MPNRPTVVVFDVNETLSDMSPMAERFADVGAERHLAKLWFATLLRDGFALTAAGSSEAFARLGEGVLRQVLADVDLDRGSDDAVAHVMAGFGSLALHPDVVDGVTALRASGLRLVTLSNGSTKVAEALFDAAGSAGSSRPCSASRTPGSGSRRAGRTSTRRGSAAPTSRRCCSSPSTRGTSTVPNAPACPRRG
jgi:2-haloalkanoic acid dehalogenase type II